GQRQLGVDIESAVAQIDVGIVQADRGVPEQHLARTGRRYVDILPSQNVRPAILVDAYGLGHDVDPGLRRIGPSERRKHSIGASKPGVCTTEAVSVSDRADRGQATMVSGARDANQFGDGGRQRVEIWTVEEGFAGPAAETIVVA